MVAEALVKVPFYSGGRYLREQFPFRVFKIAIDAGFNCPNRDGSIGYGGCTYCGNASFSPNSRVPRAPIAQQIADGIRFYRERLQGEKFIVYFQAYTNTHGPLDRLRQVYDEALGYTDVVGLAVGTRPDCVPDRVLDLLARYAGRTHLWLELGLQSSHDTTLQRLNRRHTYAQFVDAVRRAQERALRVCAHVILGLPGETREMMLETADRLAQLGLDGVKLHHFYVTKGTALERLYRRSTVRVLTLREYVGLACDFLERTPTRVVVQRLTGEVAEPYVVAPHWGVTKLQVIHLIGEEFRRRDTRQGSRVKNCRLTH
ncbi:MAG: TIGR01212 family radical SAM protein [Nitrospirae bacterium]|nr:TIGR01212 family radical SAM protein [Nitrospirota bacterium]